MKLLVILLFAFFYYVTVNAAPDRKEIGEHSGKDHRRSNSASGTVGSWASSVRRWVHDKVYHYKLVQATDLLVDVMKQDEETDNIEVSELQYRLVAKAAPIAGHNAMDYCAAVSLGGKSSTFVAAKDCIERLERDFGPLRVELMANRGQYHRVVNVETDYPFKEGMKLAIAILTVDRRRNNVFPVDDDNVQT